MRKTYQSILKTYFNHVLVRRRTELRMTQAQMAELLHMDDRSYIELDHGRSGCSALTLALYLVYLCEDVQIFTEGLRHAFRMGRDSAA